MWKLEFEAVDESRLPFFVGLSGKLEQSVRKREDYSKRKRKVYPSLEEYPMLYLRLSAKMDLIISGTINMLRSQNK